jgi:hypothetical protein
LPTLVKLLTRRLVARARDLCADKSGAAAVVAAIVFPIVIGGLGLGAETGYWYLSQRKLQHAADVSAHAAGVRLRAGDGTTQINAAALNIATASGLSGSVGSIVVNAPPLSGAKAGEADSVEVILTEVHPRLFSSVFSSQPVTIKGRAVASIVANAKACVLALSPTASGAITVSGSANVVLAGCDVASNSNASDSFLMSGAAASLSAGCVDAVGGAVANSKLTLTQCPAVKALAPAVRDPYAAVTEPSAIGPCHDNKVGASQASTTLTPTDNQPSGIKSMRFCNGLNAKGTVTFSPGLYIIENGNFSIGGRSQITGAGVTFYFVNGGTLKLAGNASLTLSAPTDGPLSGILYFGSRTSAGANPKITGTSASTLRGAIYMPASDIAFAGNSSTTNGCTQVIARTVTFTGSSSLGSSCAGSGTSTIATNETVQIVE